MLFVIFYPCRYAVPGLHGMNFVLDKVLGGGGVASLRTDPQVSLVKWGGGRGMINFVLDKLLGGGGVLSCAGRSPRHHRHLLLHCGDLN
jgi:hypothetical protein